MIQPEVANRRLEGVEKLALGGVGGDLGLDDQFFAGDVREHRPQLHFPGAVAARGFDVVDAQVHCAMDRGLQVGLAFGGDLARRIICAGSACPAAQTGISRPGAPETAATDRRKRRHRGKHDRGHGPGAMGQPVVYIQPSSAPALHPECQHRRPAEWIVPQRRGMNMTRASGKTELTPTNSAAEPQATAASG